jgi:hypothetical protein
MAISDSALHRLPTINRDFYDFVRLSPQIRRARGSGASRRRCWRPFQPIPGRWRERAGAPWQLGRGTGQGAKAISLEAIREYQVLLSPYDVRYGDFAEHS